MAGRSRRNFSTKLTAKFCVKSAANLKALTLVTGDYYLAGIERTGRAEQTNPNPVLSVRFGLHSCALNAFEEDWRRGNHLRVGGERI